MSKKPLTERDMETLDSLRFATDNHIEVYAGTDHAQAKGWVMPMDCGGWNGSHHSYTLTKLAARGLAERWKLGSKREKGSCRYRINDAGRAALPRRPVSRSGTAHD